MWNGKIYEMYCVCFDSKQYTKHSSNSISFIKLNSEKIMNIENAWHDIYLGIFFKNYLMCL